MNGPAYDLLQVLADNVNWLMTEKHISYGEIYRRMGLAPSTVQRMAHGEGSNVASVALMSEILGVAPWQLMRPREEWEERNEIIRSKK